MEEFLTVSEAAPKAKMSSQALYAAIRLGQFPALRIGRRIRIPLSSLNRWIETQRASEQPIKEPPPAARKAVKAATNRSH